MRILSFVFAAALACATPECAQPKDVTITADRSVTTDVDGDAGQTVTVERIEVNGPESALHNLQVGELQKMLTVFFGIASTMKTIAEQHGDALKNGSTSLCFASPDGGKTVQPCANGEHADRALIANRPSQ